jgi:hypothetical protein
MMNLLMAAALPGVPFDRQNYWEWSQIQLPVIPEKGNSEDQSVMIIKADRSWKLVDY